MHAILAEEDPQAFHRELARFNVARVAVGKPTPDWESALHQEYVFRAAEGRYLEALRSEVADMAQNCPTTGETFARWFEALALIGPGQQHPLFDWLAQKASMSQMRWFLTQEVAGEAGFEDLVALTQVKLPVQAKLECARNYWDEMGHGRESGMHGPMLERMVRELELRPTIDGTVWQSLALGNTMLAMASTRRYTYHALGALGAIELTAPQRVKKVAEGMNRLGLSSRARAYFNLHAVLDVSHARAWIKEIIHPLVEADPSCARYLAEGALMRLMCGERCFNRYANELEIERLDAPMRERRSTIRQPIAMHC